MHKTDKSPTVYGSTDIAILYYILGLTNALTEAEKDDWAQTINSFQNSSGVYNPIPNEYSNGYIPWHTCGFAVSALATLGRSPQYDLKWAKDIAGANQQIWFSTFDPLLTLNVDGRGIWYAAHKIAAIPTTLIVTGQSRDYTPFFNWFWSWLDSNVDPKSGYWVRNPAWAPPDSTGFGGAFHIFFTYTCYKRQWLYLDSVINSTLELQGNGLWKGNTAGYPGLDGVYELARSSNKTVDHYRWKDIENACQKFLKIAEEQMNTEENLMKLFGETHGLIGAVAAVAECQKWFPDMVVTSVLWSQSLDIGCYI
jgi:hypothetical protein